MTNDLLTLFCLVEGESSPFSVDIEPTKTVDHLKVTIKAALSPQFDVVTAKDITLWHEAIPVPEDDDEEVVPIYISDLIKDGKKKLMATRELHGIFGKKAAKNMIHIIVERPKGMLEFTRQFSRNQKAE